MSVDHRIHPVKVAGFDGSLDDLARSICAMRYDKMAELFDHVSQELDRQAVVEFRKDHPRMGRMLAHTSYASNDLKERLEALWDLSKRHMTVV